MAKNGYCAMKKIATLLMCLFSSFGIFSETVYKVSRTYIEKGNMGNETSRRTYYFVKSKGMLKKYYQEENGMISKEIEMQVLEHHDHDSILVMTTHGQRICSLYEIKFTEGNSITINGDTYVLEKESYDRLYSNTMKKVYFSEMTIDTIFSLFSMTPYFLIDRNLPEMPYDLLCDIEQYKILSGHFSVEDPHSNGNILEHACIYEYDESGNLKSMKFRCETPNYLGVDYSLEVTSRNKKEILKKESYSSFERMSSTQVIHLDIEKAECDMAGDYFAYPTSNEFTFSEIIKCEKMQESEYKTLFTF